jgi:tetratricopeptide (TPR) repeat protein
VARVKYVVPPLLAIALVVGVQSYNSVQPGGAPAPAAAAPDLRAPGAADAVPVTEVAPVGAGAVDTSDMDHRIEFWRARADAHPQSEQEWIYIGDLFDLKGRATGDIAEFVAARDAYDKATQIAPFSTSALSGKARIRATLHDFQGAADDATRILQLDPSADDALAVLCDASVELGDVTNARLALDRLAERTNSPAVTIREAKLAFLGGDAVKAADVAGEAATAAADSAATGPSIAFYNYSAGEYALLAGDVDAAATSFEASLAELPGYPLAMYGQARVAYARGETDEAIGLLESVVAAVPRPDVLAFLGDLYSQAGDTSRAADEYATVDFIADMATRTAGAVYDREYALYLADHGVDAEHALDLAQAEVAVRHDVYAYDTLAWSLHANGRDAEALEASRQAMATGTLDAKLLIHAGLIELANGLDSEGQAHLRSGLDLDPAFSPLVIQAAREALE